MGCVFAVHVIAIGQKPGFDPFDQVWAPGMYIKILTGLKQRVPKRHTVFEAVDIDFKTALLGIARPRNGHADALKVKPAKAEELGCAHRIAEDTRHLLLRFVTLYRKW